MTSGANFEPFVDSATCREQLVQIQSWSVVSCESRCSLGCRSLSSAAKGTSEALHRRWALCREMQVWLAVDNCRDLAHLAAHACVVLIWSFQLAQVELFQGCYWRQLKLCIHSQSWTGKCLAWLFPTCSSSLLVWLDPPLTLVFWCTQRHSNRQTRSQES